MCASVRQAASTDNGVADSIALGGSGRCYHTFDDNPTVDRNKRGVRVSVGSGIFGDVGSQNLQICRKDN